MVQEEFSWNKVLFGSIKRKFGWSFGILLLLLIFIVIVTANLSNQIQKDSFALKNVEAPLNVMVEQVIGYDAILTGNAHWSLLHAEKGEYGDVVKHKIAYDDTGIKLDNLLKFEARNLLNQSKRSSQDKYLVENYLEQLDIINLKLVDLEMGAFDAIEKGDLEKARSLIVSEQYEGYKIELADLYTKWVDVEAKVSEEYRQRVLENTSRVIFYNFFLGALFILIASIIPFFILRSIYYPIKEVTSLAERIKEGDYSSRVNIKTSDELEILGDTLTSTAESLKSLEDERKQVDKAKTEFLSITSHELRSPMTPMKAQLQMLLQNYYGNLNSKQRESLSIVLNNTERLDKILLDFLEISRIEAARLKFNFIKVNLNDSVKELKKEMDAFLPEKKIVIELKLSDLPKIEADPDRVMQVLRNLITNAKKFSPNNSKIIVSSSLKGEQILFSVRDFGVGIKKEQQGKIFEPFYQVDNMYQHKSGGTGLGLAICKGIVESQGGKIGFNSEEGKGTLFYFTIPLEPVREIKPIRLLFSSKQNIEEKLKNIFLDVLGPIGALEFDNLKTKGIFEEILMEYIDELYKKKIINNKEEFKNKIRLVFEGNKEEKRGVKKEDSKAIKKLAKSFESR